MGKGIYIDKARQGREGSDNPLHKIFSILSSCRSPLMAWLARSCPALSAQGTHCTAPLQFPESRKDSWWRAWFCSSKLWQKKTPDFSEWSRPSQGTDWDFLMESVTCLRALRAMVWKACSTLIASLALVSKYGMLFLLWHQACARLVVTWNTKELTLYFRTTRTGQCWIKAICRIVPLLCSLKEMVHMPYVTIQTHLSVLQVDLVAQHHEREILWVSRTSLDQEFVPPAV